MRENRGYGRVTVTSTGTKSGTMRTWEEDAESLVYLYMGIMGFLACCGIIGCRILRAPFELFLCVLEPWRSAELPFSVGAS